MITCFKCGQKNEPNSNYCTKCGRELVEEKKPKPKNYTYNKPERVRCPSCGAEGEENFTYRSEIIDKQSWVSGAPLEMRTCKRCGHVAVHKDGYILK